MTTCSTSFWATSKAKGTTNLIRVSCRRWKCDTCRKALVRKYGDHFERCVSGQRVYRSTVESADWDRHYAHLHRGDARYMTISLSETRMAVYSDKPFGAESECMTDSAAVQRFRRELGGIQSAHRCAHPITSCREWALVTEESKYERGEWTCIRPETVRRVAAAQSVAVKEWASDMASGVEIQSDSDTASRIVAECNREESLLWMRRKWSMNRKGFGNRPIPTGDVKSEQFSASG